MCMKVLSLSFSHFQLSQQATVANLTVTQQPNMGKFTVSENTLIQMKLACLSSFKLLNFFIDFHITSHIHTHIFIQWADTYSVAIYFFIPHAYRDMYIYL